MLSFFETITKRLTDAWKPGGTPDEKSSYQCVCGRPIYFRNSLCIGCQRAVGFDPETQTLAAIEPGNVAGTWTLADSKESAVYKQCANLNSPIGCNWLLAADDGNPLCRSCRLNRMIPDLNDVNNAEWWRNIEIAKSRAVAQFLRLGLPVESKVTENPEQGLMFDFLRDPVGGPRVLTGHDEGLITLNIEEADDAIREKTRVQMHEPYRTLLGHFRHEVGHYYWDRLVRDTHWLEPFRALFGDEREDYDEALRRNYEQGPPANWQDQYISSYASVHPWEDWAETWAHYMHVVDSLDTALRFGLKGEDVEQSVEPFTVEDLYDPTAPDAERIILLTNSWVKLTTVLNELARSMGQHDFYPFVMSRPVLKKMHFIQMVVKEERKREDKELPLEKLA